jgi:hypothetical protein
VWLDDSIQAGGRGKGWADSVVWAVAGMDWVCRLSGGTQLVAALPGQIKTYHVMV